MEIKIIILNKSAQVKTINTLRVLETIIKK